MKRFYESTQLMMRKIR